MVIQIASLVVIALLFEFAYRFFAKGKYPVTVVLVLGAVVVLLCNFSWIKGFAKTQSNAPSNESVAPKSADPGLSELGRKVSSVQNQTAGLQGELAKYQKQIDESQKELASLQGKIQQTESELSNSKADIVNHAQQLSSLQNQVTNTLSSLLEQEKKLQDVEYWAKNIYGSASSETLTGSDSNNVVIFPDLGLAVFRLTSAPVEYSVRGMVQKSSGGLSPLLPFPLYHDNLVGMYFDGKWEDSWQSGVFLLEYVKDARDTNLVKTISYSGPNELNADGVIVKVGQSLGSGKK